MKHIVCSILFLLLTIWGWNMAGENSVPVQVVQEDKESVEGRATQSVDEVLSVLVAANSFADVSVRTHHSFGSNLVRRYRPDGVSFDKMLAFRSEEEGISLCNSLKNVLISSQKYAAKQKDAGYFIYTLRRIII